MSQCKTVFLTTCIIIVFVGSDTEKKLQFSMKECAKKQDFFVAKAIEDLPEAQIIMVQECFSAAKKGGKRGRRYTSDWVYECILMRIKSPALYEHLRRKDILPLPTQPTLLKYITCFSLGFGFQKALFKILKNKAASMSMQQKRGNICKILCHFLYLLLSFFCYVKYS